MVRKYLLILKGQVKEWEENEGKDGRMEGQRSKKVFLISGGLQRNTFWQIIKGRSIQSTNYVGLWRDKVSHEARHFSLCWLFCCNVTHLRSESWRPSFVCCCLWLLVELISSTLSFLVSVAVRSTRVQQANDFNKSGVLGPKPTGI